MLATAIFLIAAAPQHVQTADYWGGYSGTHRVPAADASRWLTWASVDIAGSNALQPLGVKTMLYTDPNRQIAGEPLYTADESTFAHDCGGRRIPTQRKGQYLMDPRSPAMLRVWKTHVTRYTAEGHFDAIFEDDANVVAYANGTPCGYQDADWLAATVAMQRSLQYPVIYNGLSNQSGSQVSPSIGLNASAIGGMMEGCYAASARAPKVGGATWIAIENTELRMAQAQKLFFCLGLDPSDAAASVDGRLFAYASFLLAYDPASSVLWELYRGPSLLHVMPEVQLVPSQPLQTPSSVEALRASGGAYVRSYRSCSLAGKPLGPCAVAVNPDTSARTVDTGGYGRQLALAGSDVIDGGTASVVAGTSAQLGPLSAEILFK